MDRFAAKLDALGFKLPLWCDPPSELLVAEFEQRFSVALPADYRDFLMRHGGVTGRAICNFQEPTPCGTSTDIQGFYGFTEEEREDIASATELIEGAPSVIAIGDGGMGTMFWLMCEGPEAGYVYMHDHQGRSAWPDAMFYRMYPNLASEIKDYLKKRRRRQLPLKPQGYEHVYRVGTTFTEFFESLRHYDYPDNASGDGDQIHLGLWGRSLERLSQVARKVTFGVWPREDAGKRYDRIRAALRKRDQSILLELQKSGKLNEPLLYGWTPAQLAANENNLEAIRWLAKAGADLSGALAAAACGASISVMRFLIEHGCPADERRHGKTPLMDLVECPCSDECLPNVIEAAHILIENGADANAVSDEGRCVLDIAGGQPYANGNIPGRPEIVALLEKAGAKLAPPLVLEDSEESEE